MLPVAHHEAGHTVVALALGIEVVHVDASFDQQTVLEAEFSAAIQRPEVSPRDAVRAAMFCLAGTLYEEILAGIPDPDPPHRPRGGDDTDDIVRAYRFTDGVDAHLGSTQTMRLATEAATELLHQNREAAVALTVALQEEGHLTREATKDIWARHGGRPAPRKVVDAVLGGVGGRPAATSSPRRPRKR